MHAPRGMLPFWADPSLDLYRPELQPDRRIILHCAVGGRSTLAADTLQRMAYRNVAQLDGGFEGGEPRPVRSCRRPRRRKRPVERTSRTFDVSSLPG